MAKLVVWDKFFENPESRGRFGMSDESTQASEEGRLQPESVQIHFIKSSSFRVIHCDGAWGGRSPNGRFIHLALFSERLPIPQQITHEITPEHSLGSEVSRVAREGFVREIEIDAVMTPEIAEALGKWLLQNVEKIKSHNEHSSSQEPREARRRRTRKRRD